MGIMMKLIAKGNTAEVLDYSEDKVCKLFWQGYPVESVITEFENSMLLNKLKLPVPMCYGRVYIDKRHGLIYEKIQGRDLISLLRDPAKYKMVVLTLVKMHRKILNHECDTLPSYKDFVRNVIAEKDMETIRLLEDLPDGYTLCHGDFHPGNIMIDLGGGIRIIDLMNLCRGPREYDIARTYFLVGYSKLPNDMDNLQEIQAIRQMLAKDYLREMAISLNDIVPYLKIIERCHFFETSR
jgi:aminoglycoside phosphotransferase